MQRIGDYLKSGTPAIWIVDPHKRQVFAADHKGIHEVEGLIVSSDLVGEVDFNELFRRLDEPAS